MSDCARRRRRFQFRLRTLLIGVTLLAVVCGFAVLATENRRLTRALDEADLQRDKAVMEKENALRQAIDSRQMAEQARAEAEKSAQEAMRARDQEHLARMAADKRVEEAEAALKSQK